MRSAENNGLQGAARGTLAMVKSAISLSVTSRYCQPLAFSTIIPINDFAMSWRKPITEEDHLTNRIQSMSSNNSAVAVFQTHPKAEEAVRELQQSGFDMTKLSIIGKDCNYH